MTSGDCDSVFEGLSLQALCWLCAHICYRNISLLSHFCSQQHTNYLMDVQLCEHAIENHPLFLLLELKVLQLKSYQYYCHWIQKRKLFKHEDRGVSWRVEVRERLLFGSFNYTRQDSWRLWRLNFGRKCCCVFLHDDDLKH